MNDLRFAARQLLKHPGFTAVAALTLAAGIGANAVVFTWIRGVLLDAFPGAPEPGRLVVIAPRRDKEGITDTMSLPDLRALAEAPGLFAGVTGSTMGTLAVRIDKRTEWVWGESTLANFFDVVGTAPELGRTFRPGEDRAGPGGLVAVVSHRYWQQHLGGRPDVLGLAIHVNERPVTIVGVAPPGFQGMMPGLAFDLWVPRTVTMTDADLRSQDVSRNWRSFHTFGRLCPGQTRAAAQAGAETVAARLRTAYPDSNAHIRFAVLAPWQSPWGAVSLFRDALLALAAVGALLLILVSTNLANLLLVRAQGRRGEMAVRLALGASRRRLVAQLLVESLLLAALGAAGGALAAAWAAPALHRLMPPSYLPFHLELTADWRVFLLTAALGVAGALACGLAPALHAAGSGTERALKAAGRGAAGGVWRRLNDGFAVAQIALALVVLVGMGLCLRSLREARRADLGLDPRGVWLAGFKLPETATDDDTARRYYDRLLDAASRLPGVQSATLAHWIPLGYEGGDDSRVDVEGYVPAAGEQPEAGFIIGGPSLCATLGIPLVSGRDLNLADGPGADPVGLVNEEFVRRYFAGRDPLNRSFSYWQGKVRIVGVVRNAPYRRLGEAPAPFVFVNCRSFPRSGLNLALKSDRSAAGLRTEVERLAATLEPACAPTAAMALEDYLEAAFAIPRISAALLSALGALALLLASLGVYAVLAQGVAQRRREIGVRLAIGATPREVAALVMRRGLRLLCLGVLVGLLGAAGAARSLGSLLIGVGGADPAAWTGVALLLTAAVLLACWLPARRAARVDPISALQAD